MRSVVRQLLKAWFEKHSSETISPCSSHPHRSLMFSYKIIVGQSRLKNSFWLSANQKQIGNEINISFIYLILEEAKTKLTSEMNCYEGHFIDSRSISCDSNILNYFYNGFFCSVCRD